MNDQSKGKTAQHHQPQEKSKQKHSEGLATSPTLLSEANEAFHSPIVLDLRTLCVLTLTAVEVQPGTAAVEFTISNHRK